MQAGGSATTITSIELMDCSLEDIGARVLSEFAVRNHDSDVLLENSDPRIAKELTKSFRNNYLQFWDSLIRDSCQTDLLFLSRISPSGRAERAGEEKPCLVSSVPLFDSLVDLITMFSSTRARKIRVAATEAGLQLVTSLIQTVKLHADTRDMKQRQLDAEINKRKRSNNLMIRTLKEALVLTQNRVNSTEGMIKETFNRVFTHRFRDTDANIRTSCMRSIGHWMRDHPLFFLSDFYLKYLGWSLNDKNPDVRLAVLVALRDLYRASSENLALMDTFNARFMYRVIEMLDDIDPRVAAEAVSTVGLLLEASVLPHKDAGAVVSLLLDRSEHVRCAAAALIPSLASRESRNRGAVPPPCYVTHSPATKIHNENIRDTSRDTIMSVVRIIKDLQGSRARSAITVDALWSIHHSTLSDWELLCRMLLFESPEVGKPHDPVSDAELTSNDAAILSNIFACAVRRACGEQLLRRIDARGMTGGRATQRLSIKAQRKEKEYAQETFTKAAMNSIPSLLCRWSSDAAVIVPLIETLRHVKLEHFLLMHRENDFEEILNCIGSLFFQHSSRRIIDACVEFTFHAITNSHGALNEISRKFCENSFHKISERLHHVFTAMKERNGCNTSHAHEGNIDLICDSGKTSYAHSTLQNREIYFQLHGDLARLNAFLSLLPPPAIAQNPLKKFNFFCDLTSFITSAAHGSSRVSVHAVALALRALSLALRHDILSLLHKKDLTISAIAAHVSIRDDFIFNAIALAKLSDGLYSGSRILAKAVISAVTNLIICCQASHVVFDTGLRRAGIAIEVLETLELRFSESTLRTIWDTCNRLLDIPAEGSVQGVDAEDYCADGEISRLAYGLAMYDIAKTTHGFVAAELLANYGHAGHWTDHAIAAIFIDLRHLGPHAAGSTVTISLASAFEEIVVGDQEVAVDLEEAFVEFAERLAGLFMVGSQRDRVAVRCVVEEGLNFVVPTAAPNPMRLSFLSLGLKPFIPKLATKDAKSLIDPLNTVLSAVRSEERAALPLLDFVNCVATRARGACCR